MQSQPNQLIQKSVIDIPILGNGNHCDLGVIYFNIDNARHYFEDSIQMKLWPEYNPHLRIKAIMQMVLRQTRDGSVCVLMEVMSNVMPAISEVCSANGIQMIVIPYHTEESAMLYVYCLPAGITITSTWMGLLTRGSKPSGIVSGDTLHPWADVENFQVIETYPKNKKTDEWLSWTMGSEYPRSLAMVRIKLPTGSGVGAKSFSGMNNGELSIYAWHPGLNDNVRVAQTSVTTEFLSRDTGIWIAGGDLNCMYFGAPDRVGQINIEQIVELSKVGQWRTAYLGSTFTNNPWDICYKLDETESAEYNNALKSLDAMNKLPISNKSAPIVNTPEAKRFKEICDVVVKKYGNSGGALDHVFSNKIRDVLVKSHPCRESDHSVISCKIYF